MDASLNKKIAEALNCKIQTGRCTLPVDLKNAADEEIVSRFLSNPAVSKYRNDVASGRGKADRISMVKAYGGEPFLFDDNGEIKDINDKPFSLWIDCIGETALQRR